MNGKERGLLWLKEWLELIWASTAELEKLKRLIGEVDRQLLWGIVQDEFEELDSQYEKMAKQEKLDAAVIGVANRMSKEMFRDSRSAYFPFGEIKVIITPQGRVGLVNISKMRRSFSYPNRDQLHSLLGSGEARSLDWGEFSSRLETVREDLFQSKISARRKADLFKRIGFLV